MDKQTLESLVKEAIINIQNEPQETPNEPQETPNEPQETQLNIDEITKNITENVINQLKENTDHTKDAQYLTFEDTLSKISNELVENTSEISEEQKTLIEFILVNKDKLDNNVNKLLEI